MEHLFDTCTIININDPNDLLFIADYCSSKHDKFVISNIILRELKPPKIDPLSMTKAKKEKCKEIYAYVQLYVKSKNIALYDLEESPEANKNFKSIRKKYYSWMTQPNYCRYKIKMGLLPSNVYSSPGFKYKDYGECSLIAIALTTPKNYIIVSDDKGKVCAHPEINIFDKYRKKGLAIVDFAHWPLHNEVINAKNQVKDDD